MALWYYGIAHGASAWQVSSQASDPSSDIEIYFDAATGFIHRITLHKAIENLRLFLGRTNWPASGVNYVGINRGEPYYNAVMQGSAPTKDLILKFDTSVVASRVALEKALVKLQEAIARGLFPPA